MLIILAEFYALDWRYGRSGIPSECPADGGRFPYEFDEGGEPRTDRESSRSEGPDDGEAVIPDLPGDDDPRGCDSDSWENADFRRDHDHGRNSRYGWFCNPE